LFLCLSLVALLQFVQFFRLFAAPSNIQRHSLRRVLERKLAGQAT
jgi:hypothetical protein